MVVEVCKGIQLFFFANVVLIIVAQNSFDSNLY